MAGVAVAAQTATAVPRPAATLLETSLITSSPGRLKSTPGALYGPRRRTLTSGSASDPGIVAERVETERRMLDGAAALQLQLPDPPDGIGPRDAQREPGPGPELTAVEQRRDVEADRLGA